MQYEQLKALPKIDLHCHLDGSLNLACVQRILHRKDITKQDLQVEDDCKNLAEYLEKFDLPLQALQTAQGLKEGAYTFLKEAAEENIRYIEVRFAPLLSVNEILNCEQVMEAVLEGLKQAEEEVNIKAQVIVCAMRHHTREENLSMIKTARAYEKEGVCAADLAGNEAAYPMKDFMQLFEETKKLGMPFTIHAGECGSVTNIMDAVICGAFRIGHGIALSGHIKEIQLCKEKRIGIEMCPISNLQTKAVKSKKVYPLQEFLEAGLLVTINTDNRTVSNTSMTKELQFIQENYQITDEWIKRLMLYALEISFTNEEQKAKIKKWMG